MGNLTITLPQSGFSVQGNRRVHRGTLTGSTSYATSGDAYTNRGLGFNVVDRLVVYPAGNYIPQWNSSATTVIFRRDVGVDRDLVIDGANASASFALLSIGWPGDPLPTVYTSTIVRGSPFFGYLQHTGSTTTDFSAQIATGDTTTVNIHYTTASTGYGLYATTSGTLYTTNTIGNVTTYLAISDGALLAVTADTTAGTRLIVSDVATDGQRIASTLTVDINVSVVGTLSLGALREIPSGTDISGTTFHWEAEGI